MKNKYTNKIGEVTEKFLKVIGDTNYRLADKVFEYNNTAVLLLLVRVSGSGVLKVLAVSFDCKGNCLSDVTLFDYSDMRKVEAYVRSRMRNYDMEKIYGECNGDVKYALTDDVISFTGADEKLDERTADLNKYAVDKAAEIFKAAEKKGITPCKMEIDGTEFLAIEKKAADNFLGSSKHEVYSYLSCIDFIYSRRESGKTRFSYRDRHKNNSEKNGVEYFAARAEKLEDFMKGGVTLPA